MKNRNVLPRFVRLARLRKELAAAGRMSRDPPPVRIGNYDYFETTGQSNHSLMCRKEIHSTFSEVLVDPNEEGRHHALIGIGPVRVSPDEKTVAFLKDTSGEERFELVVRTIATRDLWNVPALPGVVKSLEWDATGRFLYVATTASHKETLRASQCYKIDLQASSIQLVLKELDPTFMLEISKTKDEKWIRIGCLSHSASEYWIVPSVESSTDELKLLWAREENKVYTIDHVDNCWVIFHNSALYNSQWKLLYQAESNVVITNAQSVSDGWLLVGYQNAVPWTARISVSGAVVSESTIPSAGSIEIAQDSSIEISSPNSPPEIWTDRERVNNGPCVLYTPENGIPISILPGKPSMPVLLNVYGAYGAISAAQFDPFYQPLISRGWGIAFAHVRGDGMLGPEWYRSGRGSNAFQSSLDLNECAKFLNSDSIAICASSAGALTAAGAMHCKESAGLYSAAVLRVGFLNPLQEMQNLDSSLALFERQEWGSNEEIRKFDPVETLPQVSHRLAPMYLTAADSDVRVAKSSVLRYAELMSIHQPTVPLTLKFTQGGHFGDQGNLTWIDDAAEEIDFLIKHA